MSSVCYLQIAIASPLRQYFDYLPPKGICQSDLCIGSRVEVPFGRRTMIGILMGISDHSEVSPDKLRAALKILDSEPLLSTEIMSLLQWASDYYHHPIGDAMQHALPVLLRQGKAATARTETVWQLTDAGRCAGTDELKRAPKQAALLQQLLSTPDTPLGKDDFNQQHSHWRAPIAALVKRGWVAAQQQRGLLTQTAIADSAPDLNEEQCAAIARVTSAANHFQTYLLDGVTGSGKTEVYLGIIEQILSLGQQALVLVPEISLTPQTVSRFQRRFNVPIAVMHSGLGQSERLDAWLAARNGEARIVIGTRSALFTPMAKLGVIIIDEEHDSSFKQQKGFRYHARDLAVLRARQLNIPIMLGSATPSLESLVNVEQGRYQSLLLSCRTSKATPPPIRTIDLRGQPIESGLSRTLLENVRDHLARDEQVLLFLNRRGYAPTLCCHDCGWIADCPRCDAKLTLHAASQRLRCHHCTTEQSMPAHCPECGSTELRALGQGTERIESTLETLFPNVDIVRVDRDTTRRKDAMQTMLDKIHSGNKAILVGTQMLAKGHDFPNVTLVGILDADQGLFGIDFRASESMAQQIIQVAGRAGRADKPGQVLVQTYHPDHPLLQTLLTQGYPAFAKQAIQERRDIELPPYSSMALLRAEASQRALPMAFLSKAYSTAISCGSHGIELLGPLPAPMERRAGRYRAQLLLQASERKPLQQLLQKLLPALDKLAESRRVRWSIDVDPVDTL